MVPFRGRRSKAFRNARWSGTMAARYVGARPSEGSRMRGLIGGWTLLSNVSGSFDPVRRVGFGVTG